MRILWDVKERFTCTLKIDINTFVDSVMFEQLSTNTVIVVLPEAELCIHMVNFFAFIVLCNFRRWLSSSKLCLFRMWGARFVRGVTGIFVVCACWTDEIAGIFVKSISLGSAAAVDGRIQVNDQIIEVMALCYDC